MDNTIFELNRPDLTDTNRLTKREREVLVLVVKGNSSKEVADMLYISKRTVDFHMANIYTKFKLKNRVQAYQFAQKHGLINE